MLKIQETLPGIKYLTVQSNKQKENDKNNFANDLCDFIQNSQELVRVSLVMNEFKDDEVFRLMETSIFHQRIQILQIAEVNEKENMLDPQAHGTEAELEYLEAANIEIGADIKHFGRIFMQNNSLRRLEIRYSPLPLPLILVLFQNIRANKALRELVLTDGSLEKAIPCCYEVLKESLGYNSTLQSIDFSANHQLEYSFSSHQHLLQALPKHRSLRKLKVGCKDEAARELYQKFKGKVQLRVNNRRIN